MEDTNGKYNWNVLFMLNLHSNDKEKNLLDRQWSDTVTNLPFNSNVPRGCRLNGKQKDSKRKIQLTVNAVSVKSKIKL